MRIENLTTPKSPFFSNVLRFNYDFTTDLQTAKYTGYTYVILIFGDVNFFDSEKNQINTSKFILLGPTDLFYIQGHQNTYSVALELPPQSISKVTNIQASLLKNKFVDLYDHVSAEKLDLLYNQIAITDDLKEIEMLVTDQLQSELTQWTNPLKTKEITNLIHQRKGRIEKSEILDLFKISERTLERYFANEIGVSPYAYITQIRFNHTLLDLQINDHKINKVVKDYQYFDRSHLEKDCEKFLGKKVLDIKEQQPGLFEKSLEKIYF